MGLTVAVKAGCLVQEIEDGRALRRVVKAEQEHRWPLCAPVEIEATKAVRQQWYDYDREYPRDCVTTMDEATAETKDNGFWNMIVGIEPIERAWNLSERPLLKTVPKLVPLYLRDVCSRRLHVEKVLEDLANFISRSGGRIDVKQVDEVLVEACEADSGRHCKRPRRKAMAATMG